MKNIRRQFALTAEGYVVGAEDLHAFSKLYAENTLPNNGINSS